MNPPAALPALDIARPCRYLPGKGVVCADGSRRESRVYIVYFTAYSRYGQFFFGDDIYNRDDKLEKGVALPATSLPHITGTGVIVGFPPADGVVREKGGNRRRPRRAVL